MLTATILALICKPVIGIFRQSVRFESLEQRVVVRNTSVRRYFKRGWDHTAWIHQQSRQHQESEHLPTRLREGPADRAACKTL